MSRPSTSPVTHESPDLQCIARSKSPLKDQLFYRSIRFTNDGTCVITQRNNHSLETFVLPPDLLDDEPLSRDLHVYSRGASPSSLLSYAIHPSFALPDTSSTWVLSSSVDLPISLRNALSYDHTSVSYPWVSLTTEQFHSANSLSFVTQGAHFAAGSHGQVALFDLTRPYEAPINIHRAKSRGDVHTEGLQDRGVVMALAESPSGLLAAGTSTRNITLFSASGHGAPEAHFSLESPAGTTDVCKGTGITSLAWSSDGRYLIVGERQSDCMQVYDIRHGGTRLAWMSGRNAMSTQRFDIDVVQCADGDEIWSGGVDGHVRMWRNPGLDAGEQTPSISLQVARQPVGSVSWHSSGTVLATCAGGRLPVSDTEGDVSRNDGENTGRNALSIWTTIRTSST